MLCACSLCEAVGIKNIIQQAAGENISATTIYAAKIGSFYTWNHAHTHFLWTAGQHRKEQIFLGKGHVKLGIMPCVSPGKTLQKGNHKNDSWFMHGK
jgi:hypothetical protein